jgi:hypothetical protein
MSWEVHGTGSRSCPVAGIVDGVLGSATTVA